MVEIRGKPLLIQYSIIQRDVWWKFETTVYRTRKFMDEIVLMVLDVDIIEFEVIEKIFLVYGDALAGLKWQRLEGSLF